jgi:hypothetical protein
MVAMLLGCGFRRSELWPLTVKTIQQREDHCPSKDARFFVQPMAENQVGPKIFLIQLG